MGLALASLRRGARVHVVFGGCLRGDGDRHPDRTGAGSAGGGEREEEAGLGCPRGHCQGATVGRRNQAQPDGDRRSDPAGATHAIASGRAFRHRGTTGGTAKDKDGKTTKAPKTSFERRGGKSSSSTGSTVIDPAGAAAGSIAAGSRSAGGTGTGATAGVVDSQAEREFNTCHKFPGNRRIVKLNMKPDTELGDLDLVDSRRSRASSSCCRAPSRATARRSRSWRPS